MHFMMLIKEIFNFQDGRVVFVGEVIGNTSFVTECICGLFIEEELITKINIEGEMIAKGNNLNLRSLSTTDKINSNDLPYREKKVWLKYIKQK